MGWWGDAKRNLMRRGSPSFRVGVWVAGIGGGLLWIYFDETKKPVRDRKIFLPAKREVLMAEAEIEQWNRRLSGGKLLSPQQETAAHAQLLPPEEQGVEAARAKARAAIEQQAQQEAAAAERMQHQDQQGWFSSLLGLRGISDHEQEKRKKPWDQHDPTGSFLGDNSKFSFFFRFFPK
ncbi:hypothetical protein Efla_001400 [Eimeria flavescens]